MKKYFIILHIIVIFISFYTRKSFYSFIYPTAYTNISSEYGNRILYDNANFHNGIDFLAPLGSEVIASSSGYISYASFMENGYGNTVIINHSNNIKTLYCHLSENFIVKIGQFVNAGDTIAYVGPKILSNGVLNGNTTGPHLHFSIFKNNSTINPLELLEN